MSPLSFCFVCDAPEGQCSHRGTRYLVDIAYEKAEGEGWKVPEHERARWDAAPLRTAAQPVSEARDIEDVVLEVAQVCLLDTALEDRLRRVHALEPERVSRLSSATIEGTAAGRLTSPGGFLMKRLAEIERRKT